MDNEIQVLDTDTPIEETTTYTSYERINFENGTLVSPGVVNPETGELTMPVYSGKAPINAQNLNHIEDGIKNLENYVLANGGGVEVEDSLESNSTKNAPSIHAVNQRFLTKEDKSEVIYDNSAGSTLSITLTKNITEYKYVEIEACSNILGTVVFLPLQKFKIVNPTSDNFIFLTGILTNAGTNVIINLAKGYILKNNLLSVNTENGYQVAILNLNTHSVTEELSGEIFITKVIGYR